MVRSRNWISGFDPEWIHEPNRLRTLADPPTTASYALGSSRDFRSDHSSNHETGILLDVETPGMDRRKDEIIELGPIRPNLSLPAVRTSYYSEPLV